MSLFHTAPLDPIFWLHHCNIDRLWEIWRNLQNTELPTVTPWLDFRFGFGTGTARLELAVADVQHTTLPPLGYSYAGVPVPPGAVPGAVPGPAGITEEVMEEPPELVGASDEPVSVGAGPGRARLAVAPSTRPPGPAPAGAEVAAGRTFLTLEHITGTGLGAGVYVVSLSVPDAVDPLEMPDRQVGRFSTFGLIEASDTGGEMAGSGLTFTFDITDLVERLESSGDWDPDHLDIAISPARPVEGDVEEIRIGRVGVYRE
jgi:tyrosinase